MTEIRARSLSATSRSPRPSRLQRGQNRVTLSHIPSPRRRPPPRGRKAARTAFPGGPRAASRLALLSTPPRCIMGVVVKLSLPSLRGAAERGLPGNAICAAPERCGGRGRAGLRSLPGRRWGRAGPREARYRSWGFRAKRPRRALPSRSARQHAGQAVTAASLGALNVADSSVFSCVCVPQLAPR